VGGASDMTKAADDRASDRPWSVPVTVHEVPVTGRRFQLHADEPVRAAVARTIGLSALPRLDATFEVTRHGRDGLRVAGRVSARVGQLCVATLDPIESDVEEAVDVIFDPDAAPKIDDAAGKVPPRGKSAAKTRSKEAVTVELDGDAPEPLIGDTVDLGAVAIEFLILGLDPYPRKPGASFEVPAVEDETEHPFAALAKLRSGQDGNEP
jgi:hypothetical protein